MENNVTLNTLEQSMEEIVSFFETDDEELEQIRPVLMERVSSYLTGPEGMMAIQEAAKEYDLMGYSYNQITDELNQSKNWIYGYFLSLKEQYHDSEIKQELIDMIYGLVETYLNMAVMYYANREETNIGIELIHPTAKIPTYAHEGDQGADIYAPETVVVPTNARGYMVHTGIKLLIPYGWAVSIRPRSGMSKKTPLRISNSPATIDQQYRGEICILFDNLSNEPYEIKEGERIAQFILEKNYHANYTQVDSVESDTERGEGGFGSSGN